MIQYLLGAIGTIKKTMPSEIKRALKNIGEFWDLQYAPWGLELWDLELVSKLYNKVLAEENAYKRVGNTLVRRCYMIITESNL